MRSQKAARESTTAHTAEVGSFLPHPFSPLTNGEGSLQIYDNKTELVNRC